MRRKTKQITITAAMTALSVAILYIASIFPSGSFVFVAISSLAGIVTVIEYRLIAGVFVYAATAILSFLIVPSKSIVLLYALFFGYYPVIKSVFENFKSRFLEWICKIAVFNAVLTIFLIAFSSIIYDSLPFKIGTVFVVLIFNIVFILFDLGLSKLIAYYISRISKKLKYK